MDRLPPGVLRIATRSCEYYHGGTDGVRRSIPGARRYVRREPISPTADAWQRRGAALFIPVSTLAAQLPWFALATAERRHGHSGRRFDEELL